MQTFIWWIDLDNTIKLFVHYCHKADKFSLEIYKCITYLMYLTYISHWFDLNCVAYQCKYLLV